ncbi:MAG TPA: hypothetical protein DGT23_17325 [Micromonosporaceae bacterium]|nr:hypothetical protein [Micromonosporaceae bacterium]
MRIGRLILACSLTTASGLLLSTSGQTASTISLKPEHANTTAWAFSKKSCDGFPDILSTLDGWHFVLPKSVNARFISITLNFNPGNLVVGPITSTSRQAPTPGRGWTGYLASPGDNFQHAYVKVPAGLTLAGGTAQVDPSVAHGNFQINDVCARPSAPPRAQPPSASQAASAQASSGGASPSQGGASPSEGGAFPSQGGASPSEGKASPSKDKQRNASPSQSQGERSKSPLAKATASALESFKARSQAPSGEPSKPESSAKASSSAQARTATGGPTAPASKAASSSAAPRLPGSPPVAPGGPEVGGGPQTLAVPRLPALEGNLFAPPGGPGMAPAGGAETGGGGSQSTAFGPGTMALIAVGALVAFVLRRRENVA